MALDESPEIMSILKDKRFHGWFGVAVAMFGFLVPTGILIWMFHLLANSDAWVEGEAYEACWVYAFVVINIEANSLKWGVRNRPTVAGRIAVGLSTTFLLLMLAFIVRLLVR